MRRVADDHRADAAHLRLVDGEPHRLGGGHGADAVMRIDERQRGALLDDFPGCVGIDELVANTLLVAADTLHALAMAGVLLFFCLQFL